MRTARKDPRIQRGMAAQLELRQTRLQAGEKSLGWKVGFGSPEAMERLRIDAPLIGFLTDKARLPSQATVSIADWVRAGAEPEIAVYLGEDLPGGSDRETTRAAIASIGPAIELVDLSFAPDDVEAILSGNVYNRHVILGRADDSRAGCVLDGLVGRVYRDGKEVAATTDPQAATGDLVNIVQHVADQLAALGPGLRAGEVIITGAIVPPVWIETQEEFGYTLDPVDTILVNLTVA